MVLRGAAFWEALTRVGEISAYDMNATRTIQKQRRVLRMQLMVRGGACGRPAQAIAPVPSRGADRARCGHAAEWGQQAAPLV
jgi:hypothetical protein